MFLVSDHDGASLRALVALLFHEADVRAYLDLVKAVVEHTVTMKIDFAAIGGLQKAIVLIGKKFGDACLWRFLMDLYVARCSRT